MYGLLQDEYIECIRIRLEQKHLPISSIERHALCQLPQQQHHQGDFGSRPGAQAALQCTSALLDHFRPQLEEVQDAASQNDLLDFKVDSILHARSKLHEEVPTAAAAPVEDCLITLATLQDVASSSIMLQAQTSPAKHAEAVALRRNLGPTRIQDGKRSIELSLDLLVPCSSIQQAAKLVQLRYNCRPSRARTSLERRLQAANTASRAADAFLHMISTVAANHMLWLQQAMSIDAAKVELLAELFPDIVAWLSELCQHIISSVKIHNGDVTHTPAAAVISAAGYFVRGQQRLDHFMQQLDLPADVQQRYNHALAQFEGFSFQGSAPAIQTQSLQQGALVQSRRDFAHRIISDLVNELVKTLQDARSQHLVPFHLIEALRR